MNKFDPDALMKAQVERMKRAQAAAEAELRSADHTRDRNWRAEEAARNVLTQENPAALPHVIWTEARRARELAEIAVGKESLADLKSGKASGDLRTPDLDFALPLELTEIISKATQHEIRSPVLQIHAKLLNHDPELKDCADNGRHLQALFGILASKLFDRADFDRLLDVSIPAMVAAIKNELGWRWPSGDAEMLKRAFLLGSILKWRLKSQAIKATPQPATDRTNLRRDPGLQQLKSRVRKLRGEGLSHKEICDCLGDSPRPPRATWRDLTWTAAYKRNTSAVTKWLSDACH